MLKRIAAATTLPVSVARAAERLKIESSEFDADLEALILAASAVFENRTQRIAQTSGWEYRTGNWPCGLGPLQIPAAPVRDVTGISYLDIEGVEQSLALSAADFRWERTDEGADIFFERSFDFPSLLCDPQAIRVQFSAGYDYHSASGSGDDPELEFPPEGELAILFLVGHWFENRESVGEQKYSVPQTFDLLIEGLRIFR